MALECEMMYRARCDGRDCEEVDDWGGWADNGRYAEENATSDGWARVAGYWFCKSCAKGLLRHIPQDRPLFEVAP